MTATPPTPKSLSTEVIVEPMFERTVIPVPNIGGSNGSSFFVGFGGPL